MTRNTKGQFKKVIKPSQWFILGVAVAYISIASFRAVQAGEEMKRITLRQGESIIITAEVATVTPSVTQNVPEIKVDELKGVKGYASSYGGKINENLVNQIHSYCGSVHNTKTAVAISTAETGQGKRALYANNYWNYDRFHSYSSPEQVAKDVCETIKTPGMIYNNLISDDGSVAYNKSWCYVVGCRAEHNQNNETAVANWRANVSRAFNSMK
jgi:hypothetical protein